MAIKVSNQEIVNSLKAIFEKHENERICVLATTCCGKTTLLRQIPNCVDLDDELWPQLTKEEADFISQKPWTDEIGDYIDKLVYEKITIKAGHPLFSTIIVDCDVVVYLDISDELLAEHCKKRGYDYADSKNVKKAVELDWNSHREKGGKTFYYLVLVE